MMMDTADLEKLALEVARKELREDENTREQAVVEFRDWIEKNPDISNCRTDDNFLLRFLRVKKFSVPMAEQTLIKFLKYRHDFRHLSSNLDILDPALNELVTNGYMFASPYRDEKGRQVIIIICSRNDPHKVKYQHLSRVDNMTYTTLMEDDISQVLGYTHVIDAGNITFAHATIWPALEFANAFHALQQSFPMRFKEIHILNMPPVVKFFYDIVKSSSSEKMRGRIRMHSSLEGLHKYVNPKCLPKEYGGTMPVTEMIDIWKEKLKSKRELIVGLDKIELLRIPNEDDTNVGSFRKLNVD